VANICVMSGNILVVTSYFISDECDICGHHLWHICNLMPLWTPLWFMAATCNEWFNCSYLLFLALLWYILFVNKFY